MTYQKTVTSIKPQDFVFLLHSYDMRDWFNQGVIEDLLLLLGLIHRHMV